ncbi:MAG TPA: hypothetical protein PLZ24_14660, partial [Flavobacteriales bacterium]|nr:hypothetical protein [Flavobacteriales bacterium]
YGHPLDAIAGPSEWSLNGGQRYLAMKRCRLKRSNFQIINKMSKENEPLGKHENGNDFIADVSGSVIKPPIGLTPKRFYEERVRVERFNQVCGAISRYYNAGLKINIEWIEEYNDLVESVGKHYR